LMHRFATFSARIRHTLAKITRELATQKSLEIQKDV
jgi:hypothetical protein